VIERSEIVLSAVLEPGVEVGARTRPRFVIKHNDRQVGQSVDATRADDGSFEAQYTFTSSGTYHVLFRIGSGADRIEMSTDIEVARNPHHPVRRASPDPPPVTTQGSSWSPPTIAPAWTPTPVSPTQQPEVVSAPPPADPPPPPPWTGGGSVL
jgi:hypothetical protein